MNGVFSIPAAETVAHGPGSARLLGMGLDQRMLQRALVIAPSTVATGTNLLWYVEQLLGPRFAAGYSDAPPLPPADAVVDAAQLAREADADCIVVIGGGSAIDLAKLTALAAAREPATTEEAPLVRPPLPVFALPTTLSGASFTRGAWQGDAAGRGPATWTRTVGPRAVLLDPLLTTQTPTSVWLNSALPSVAAALDQLARCPNDPLRRLLSRQALTSLMEHLPVTAGEGQLPDERQQEQMISARYQCLLASWYARLGVEVSQPAVPDLLRLRLSDEGPPAGRGALQALAVLAAVHQPAWDEAGGPFPAELVRFAAVATASKGEPRPRLLPDWRRVETARQEMRLLIDDEHPLFDLEEAAYAAAAPLLGMS